MKCSMLLILLTSCGSTSQELRCFETYVVPSSGIPVEDPGPLECLETLPSRFCAEDWIMDGKQAILLHPMDVELVSQRTLSGSIDGDPYYAVECCYTGTWERLGRCGYGDCTGPPEGELPYCRYLPPPGVET